MIFFAKSREDLSPPFYLIVGFCIIFLKEKYGVREVVISYVGSVIGSHAGPGTLALFFMGKHR